MPQTLPQAPQLLLLLLRFVSQPFAGLPSQFPHPELQEPTWQLSFEHTDAALGRLQTLLHPPQLFESDWKLVKQPPAHADPVQFPHPALHAVIAQQPPPSQDAPLTLTRLLALQTAPHAPQLLLDRRFVSHPFD